MRRAKFYTLPRFWPINSKTYKTQINSNIEFSKEIIQYRRDNIIYFVDSSRLPLDNGAESLFKTNEIERKRKYTPGSIRKIVVKKNVTSFSV